MPEKLTPLAVAFVWHMHQPDYKDALTGEYLMPWVRLHAVKDYLDMALVLEKHPRIRQTFNLVPSLIVQLEDYCKEETRDRHMTVMLADTLTDADRRFIFERFFDAPTGTMIARSSYYRSLLDRRNALCAEGEPDPATAFNDAEYFDITALFHLVWTDPMWFDAYTGLAALWAKGRDFTQKERREILETQRDIIRRILPEYKKLQDAGHIEVTTTPFYHPILPLLIDTDSACVAMPGTALPEVPFRHPEDATYQLQAAQDCYRRLFGHTAPGIWPSEQSVSPAAVVAIREAGFRWAISSEGVLARSLGTPFEKDPYGNIVNVEALCRPYGHAGVNMIFRHLTLSDLIGFQYATMPPEHAATDLYQRIKQVQKRCTQAKITDPILTIALDGENCWESYPNDGHAFLEALYRMLGEDRTLDVTRVCDYFDRIAPDAVQELPHLHSGSWINSDYHIWIGDPVKNAAWTYLKRTRDDLYTLSTSGHYRQESLEAAWHEIHVAEGSDWFWWYGEPNNSGQDHIFDMQFRRHLANVYRLLDVEIPNYLEIPLTVTMGRPIVPPADAITPPVDGRGHSQAWLGAGSFDLTHGAMHRATRILNKVHFGSDRTHAYMRFDLNTDALSAHHELYLYIITAGKTRHNSPIRLKSASGHTVATQRWHYAYEIQLANIGKDTLTVNGAEALPDHLWVDRHDLVSRAAYDNGLEIALPFDAFNVWDGEYLQITLALVQGGVLEEFQPAAFNLSVQRAPAFEELTAARDVPAATKPQTVV